jgi:hypothetical protein
MGINGWTKERFESSVSFRALEIRGMDIWPSFENDTEMHALVAAEENIRPIPKWAEETVEQAIKWPTLWCPHYLFPQPLLDVVAAIGNEEAMPFVHSCYTVGRERKERLADYVFCLDAWFKGATNEQASSELRFRNRTDVNWDKVCSAVWSVLGQKTEIKELLVERMLHRQRWWLKTSTWDDDRRDKYCTDQYLGDIRGDGDSYGNPGYCDPYSAETETPHSKRLKQRLDQQYPDWQGTWGAIEHSHLCAPKAFRFLERLIWFIGKGEAYSKEQKVIPGFLECEDTYPDTSGFSKYASQFLVAVRKAAKADKPSNLIDTQVVELAGDMTATKSWLLRLFARKLELHAATFQPGEADRKAGKAGRLETF